MPTLIDDNSYIDPGFGSMSTGLVPRDMKSFPMGAFAPPMKVPPLSDKEIRERIRERKATRSTNLDIRNRGMYGQMIPSLNQNDPMRPRHWGYCWYYASVTAMLLLRAKMNQPYIKLSAFGGAYTMKRGQNEGGWGAQSMQDLSEGRHGALLYGDWPDFDTRMRSSTDACWQNALNYQFTEGFCELEAPIYDQDLTMAQKNSILGAGGVTIDDLMWMGHCMPCIDIDEVYPDGPFKYAYWNSWGDGRIADHENGILWITGKRAVPDNSVSPTVATAF